MTIARGVTAVVVGSSLTLGKMKRQNLYRWLVICLGLVVAGVTIALLVCRSAPNPHSVTSDDAAPAASPTDIETRAERERHVNFSGVALEHIAEHFAAVSGRRITVAPEVARLKMSGSITIDNVDAFLRLLPRAMPVRVEVSGDGSVRILPKNSRQ
jgi:hypothetical protein